MAPRPDEQRLVATKRRLGLCERLGVESSVWRVAISCRVFRSEQVLRWKAERRRGFGCGGAIARWERVVSTAKNGSRMATCSRNCGQTLCDK
jgi:hypothetical protein